MLGGLASDPQESAAPLYESARRTIRLVGEKGGCALDLLTHFAESSGSHDLEVNEEAVDAEQRVFQARWS